MHPVKHFRFLSQASRAKHIAQLIAQQRHKRNSKHVGGKKKESNGGGRGVQRRRSRVNTPDKSADGLLTVPKDNYLPVPKYFDSPLYEAAGKQNTLQPRNSALMLYRKL